MLNWKKDQRYVNIRSEFNRTEIKWKNNPRIKNILEEKENQFNKKA